MNKIIIILGPSGAGKSTLEKKLANQNNNFQRIISATTREPRIGEINGIDYFFMSKQTFDATEMAEFDSIDDNFYGTPANQLKTSKDLIITMEPNGAKKIINYLKIHHPEKRPYIVYFNISAEKRIENMNKRGDVSEKILKRIKNDDINERWIKSGLTADLEINELNETLDEQVLNLIKDV